MAAKKPTPTRYTIKVTNPQNYEMDIPAGGAALRPGKTREVVVRQNQLNMYKSNRFLEVEIVGDNSAELARTEKDWASRIQNAKERHAALTQIRDEAREEERRMEDVLRAAESEEASAKGADLAAMKEAGRSRDNTAAGVLRSAGAKSDEIEGLRFDHWGAQVRRIEAEAAVLEVESLLAADESSRLQSEIRAADRKIEDAQNELTALRRDQNRKFNSPDRLAKEARNLRARAALLDESGPVRVAS